MNSINKSNEETTNEGHNFAPGEGGRRRKGSNGRTAFGKNNVNNPHQNGGNTSHNGFGNNFYELGNKLAQRRRNVDVLEPLIILAALRFFENRLLRRHRLFVDSAAGLGFHLAKRNDYRLLLATHLARMFDQTKAGTAEQYDTGHEEVEQLEQRAFHTVANIYTGQIQRKYLTLKVNNFAQKEGHSVKSGLLSGILYGFGFGA